MEMKRKIKAYLVFTSLVYRIVVYLLVPASLAAIAFCTGSKLAEAGIVIAALLLTLAEILADNWLFGGIQTKDVTKLDYLRTSGRGMQFMRDALALDLLRRMLTAIGTMAACYLVIQIPGGARPGGDGMGRGTVLEAWMGEGLRSVQVLLYFAFLSYFISVLGTLITRFGSMLWMNMVTGYGAVVLMAVVMYALGLPESVLGTGMIFLGLDIIVSVLTVNTAMRKVEGSYCEK